MPMTAAIAAPLLGLNLDCGQLALLARRVGSFGSVSRILDVARYFLDKIGRMLGLAVVAIAIVLALEPELS
jgi:hypothetical protein